MKKVFMPQKKFSAQTDILQALDFTLSKADGYKVADALYKYWESRSCGLPSFS
jgi:hypothetical protein